MFCFHVYVLHAECSKLVQDIETNTYIAPGEAVDRAGTLHPILLKYFGRNVI